MTTAIPVLPSFLPRPASLPHTVPAVSSGIPVASFAMQKVLTKAIRSHSTNQNLRSTAVKSADKMGGKRASHTARTGRAAPTAKK